MNIQAQKLELVKMILEIEDKTVLKNVAELVKASKADWWDKTSDAEKAAIEEGLAQANRGELIPHQQVMKDIKAKYKVKSSK
jgi:predicted transcriptional regulator